MKPRLDSTRGHRARGPYAAIAAVLLVARAATAQPPDPVDDVRLVWTRAPAASACPEASAIEADVARRLGTNPFRPDSTGSIDVYVTREGDQWTALIEDRPTGGAPAGSRLVTSTAATCDSLALAVGLAISLMIRERASAMPNEPASAPPPPPPPAPAPPPPAPVADAPARGHAAVYAAAVAGLGVLPDPAPGAAVGGRVELGERAALVGSLSFLPEQRARSAAGDLGFSASFGGLGACYELVDLSGLALSACASALFGAMTVVVWDPAPVRPGSMSWGATSFGLRSDWILLDPVQLLVSVDGFVPWKRRSYVVERDETANNVFTQPGLGALLALGIGVGP